MAMALATLRPPIGSTDIEVTAMSLRAVQLSRPVPIARMPPRLSNAHGTGWHRRPRGTEDRAFRCLGSPGPGPRARRCAPLRVTCSRVSGAMADGDRTRQWIAMPMRRAQALVALQGNGVVPAGEPAIRRGVEYLLGRGSRMFVVRQITSRADPGLFRKRLSLRRHQWISAAARPGR